MGWQGSLARRPPSLTVWGPTCPKLQKMCMCCHMRLRKGVSEVKQLTVYSCQALSRSPETLGVAGQVRRTLPFGAGARACIGMPLAQLILPTTIATLLGHFHFRLAAHVSPPRA